MSTGVQRTAKEDKPAASGALALLNESVLGLIRAQAPLPKILEILCTHVEKQYPGLLCSVLLLDADGSTLRHGAAPSLPKEYTQATNGAQSGPCAGSCGTAVYRKQAVIVADIATDPLSLAGYDAFILQSRKDSCDLPATETEPTQPDDDEQTARSDDRRRRD